MSPRFEKLADDLLETSNRLSKHCKALAKEQSPYWDCWWPKLEKLSSKHSAEVDAAARLLAVGKLGEPSCPEICAFLILRLHIAAGVIQSLEGESSAAKVISFPKPANEMQDAQITEWLLIDFWHGLGNHVWMWIGFWEFDMWQLSHDEPRPHRLSDDQIVT